MPPGARHRHCARCRRWCCQPPESIVTIDNAPENRVLLDGRELARGQSRVEIGDPAAGASHRLMVSAPGRLAFDKDFIVTTGASIEMPPVHTTTPAETPEPPPPRKPVPDERPAKPTRAQERGLLDENPLR